MVGWIVCSVVCALLLLLVVSTLQVSIILGTSSVWDGLFHGTYRVIRFWLLMPPTEIDLSRGSHPDDLWIRSAPGNRTYGSLHLIKKKKKRV